jgi:sugar phosphate isomerase/epimerase
MQQSFAEDLALWADLGLDNVGLIAPKLEAFGWAESEQAVIDAKLKVSSMSAYKPDIVTSLPFTAAVGCSVLYTVTGGFGTVPWEEAANAFCQEMAPIVAAADRHGVRLAIEPTNPLRSDVSFVFSVRDAIELARRAGTGIVVDFYSAWYERDLDRLVHDNADLVAMVQIGDYKLGTFDIPNRCAVGDGDIPVERLLATVLDAGYQGPFDLEILGPRIEEEGYRAPIVRSVERVTEMLDRLGAGEDASGDHRRAAAERHELVRRAGPPRRPDP